jgi:hypothetical protein
MGIGSTGYSAGSQYARFTERLLLNAQSNFIQGMGTITAQVALDRINTQTAAAKASSVNTAA